MNRANLFTIEVNGQRLIESNDRQRFFWSRRSSVIEYRRFLFSREPLAHVVVRDHRRFWSKNSIAARMISVPVSVKNEAQLLVGKSFECSLDLVREWRVLIVDNQKTIVTDRDTDVSTRSFEHVDVARNLGGFDFHLRKVSLRLRRDGKEQHNS